MERLEISSRKLEIPRELSCKDGLNKDRNGMDLTEAENIRGGRNTQNCTKKIFMTQITTMV